VANIAHIGGLASGTLLGVINLKFLGDYDAEVLEPAPEDKISPLIEKALERISELDLDGGSRLLEQVLAIDPKHTGAMTHIICEN